MSTPRQSSPPGDPPSTGGPTGARPAGGGPNLPAALTRGREGRWLAGVCVGLARHRRLPLRSVRTAFAVTALVGGVGVFAYLACWLIIPAEGDEQTGLAGTRGIVVLAQACAGCAGLATLAAVGAAATIFGFGLAVLVIAAVVLLATLASWPRVGAGWALLPVTALVLPALAMAVGDVRIAPETHDLRVAPQSVANLPRGGYTSGLGTLLVDLRHTTFPARGNVALRIDAGVRRTIVALPAGRCVYVELDYDVVPFAARVASVLSGRDRPFSGVAVFGELQGSRTGEAGNAPSPSPGSPILQIHFHSAGGSVYVRDYPDGVDPQSQPDWPGYPVELEPRPDTTGATPRAVRAMIDSWLLRRRVQSASAKTINRLMPGPCGANGSQPLAGQLARATPPAAYGPPKPEATGGAYDPGSGVPVPPAAPLPPNAGGAKSGGTVAAGKAGGATSGGTVAAGKAGGAKSGGTSGTSGPGKSGKSGGARGASKSGRTLARRPAAASGSRR